MSNQPVVDAPDFECPVSIVMSREDGRQGPWRFPRWALLAVLTGQPDAGPVARREVHADATHAEYLWTGFYLCLHKDAAESYWYNLTGSQPLLFVLCRPGPDIDLEPCMVTADHDEAGAMMEADEQIFSAPIPAALVAWLERFITQYYRPGPRKKRKRREWTKEAGDGHRG